MIGNLFNRLKYAKSDFVLNPKEEEILVCTKCTSPKCKGDCERYRKEMERIKNDKKREKGNKVKV
jgi:hypothetical protein